MLHIVLVLLMSQHQTNGHARLIDPPSRASMFRFGYNTPPDYNDNQGFCGGKAIRQLIKDGCGVCGDPWYEAVKSHEAGGIYATGQIVRTYKAGALITATVQVTANHKGYFEFRICVNNDVTKPATHECLDKHLLQLGDRPGTKFYIDNNNGDKKVSLKLPKGVVCSQCVFQWKYYAGNSWGIDPNGKLCVGCGLQDEFYACADIAIVSGGMTEILTTGQPQALKTSSFAPVQISQGSSLNKKCHAVGEFENDQDVNNWCVVNCARLTCPDHLCRCYDDRGEDDAPYVLVCNSHGIVKSNNVDEWCNKNCQLGLCPDTHCTCEKIRL